MKKTRLISGLAAFMIASSAVAVYADTETKNSFNPKDFISYFQGNYNGNMKSFDFDVNCDNKVNILDMIYARSAAAGDITLDTEKYNVKYMNTAASVIAEEAARIMQKLETEGKCPDKLIYTYADKSGSKPFTESERRIYEAAESAAETCGIQKWTVVFSKDYSVSCITGDSFIQRSGAYPHSVPVIMNIPYSDKLISYASDFKSVWINDFPECVTTDPAQLKFAEISEKATTSELNSYAKSIFSAAQTLMQEYEIKGLIVNFDGTSETELQHTFLEELSEYLPADVINKGLAWRLTTADCVVNGVAVADEDSTGAYPNAVPANMRIPYNDNILKYLSGSSEIWKEKFSEYTLENAEGDYSSEFVKQIQKAYIDSCNKNAKTVFTNTQTILQEMETRGEKLTSETVITSDDDTETAKQINSLITGNKDFKWAVYVKDFTVEGAVYSITPDPAYSGYQFYDTEKNKFVYIAVPETEITYTGSFPVSVPSDTKIDYDHSLVKNYEKDIRTWNWETASENPGTETPSEPPAENISQTSKVLINSYNSSAHTLYTGAATVIMEHELFGNSVPDGIITSDDKSDIAAEINSSVIGSGSRKWAAYVRGGEIAGIVYTENGNITGSYPASVSTAVKYDHSLALKYKDNSVEW